MGCTFWFVLIGVENSGFAEIEAGAEAGPSDENEVLPGIGASLAKTIANVAVAARGYAEDEPADDKRRQ